MPYLGQFLSDFQKLGTVIIGAKKIFNLSVQSQNFNN